MVEELSFLSSAIEASDPSAIARSLRAALPRLHFAWVAANAPTWPESPWDQPVGPFAELLHVADALQRSIDSGRPLTQHPFLGLREQRAPIGALSLIGCTCACAVAQEASCYAQARSMALARCAEEVVAARGRPAVVSFWQELTQWVSGCPEVLPAKR